MKNQMNTFAGEVSASAHTVEFWYDIEDWSLTDEHEKQLSEAAKARAQEMIAKGCRSGDLCEVLPDVSEEFTFFGAWHIASNPHNAFPNGRWS